jgi:hypothetical protein
MLSTLDEHDIDYIATQLSMISAGHVLKDCKNQEHIGELERVADRVMGRIVSKMEKIG